MANSLQGFSKVLFLAVTLLLIGSLFHESSMTLIVKWTKFTESYGHGFLVLGLIFLEIYNKRFEIEFQRPPLATVLICTALVIAGLICLVVSIKYEIELIEQASVYGLWVVTIPLFFSFKALKALWFPIFFFVFAIPVWDQVNSLLVVMTSWAVSLMLAHTSITFHIYENVIELPFGTLIIADSCSGLRYLIVGAAMVTYATYIENLQIKKSLFYILIGVLISVFANWLRVLIITVVAYNSKMQSSLVNDHDNFGLILFFIILFPLFLLISRKNKQESAQIESTM
ncbi:exosortase [Alteromonas mediterranea]|uniref:exosortase n=1 Tax=Alteromonas mediterranea TaxID=314275 RepID=UPI0018C8B97C|nr:exosortase [Alteromonas mediterranea]